MSRAGLLTAFRSPPDNPLVSVSAGKPTPRSAVFRRSLQRDFPAATRGEGVYLWDEQGNRYLDFSGSAAVNFIGHGVTEISAAMAEQARKLEFVHTSQFTTPVAEEYARELIEFAGDGFRGGAVYFTSGGSEAVETALKLARQYQVEAGRRKRWQILSRDQSYHGSTLGALAVSGNKRRREMYLPMVRELPHIGFPYCYRCAYRAEYPACELACVEEIEQHFTRHADPRSLAAVIVEPVLGEGGFVVPPPG